MNNELYHHGIKGQKWGVRRYQNYDGTRIKSGRESGTSTLQYHSKALEVAKVTAISVGKQAVAYISPGAALAINIVALNNLKKYSFDTHDYSKEEGEFEKLSQLKKKREKLSLAEDASMVNPRIGKQSGTVNNCMNCTTALEMRRRGYDVIARKSGAGIAGNSFETWFPGSKTEYMSVNRKSNESKKDYINRSYSKLCDTLESFGKGAHGAVGVRFDKLSAGHSMFWEITDDGIMFYDGQLGNGKTDKTFSFADPTQYSYTRLDNCSVDSSVTTRIRSNPKERE